MQLPPIYPFFNYSNDPWVPILDPNDGGWSHPGLAYNSSIAHIFYMPKTNPLLRPAQLIMKTCCAVKGGSMDILFYVGDAGKPWVDYPWKDGNMVELAILHIPDTYGSVVNRGITVNGAATDALMAMASQTNEVRFGVACRSLEGGKMRWDSAHMHTSYY